MQQIMNTLYVNTPGAYVKRASETIEVHVDGKKQMEIPLIHISGLVCFGNVLVSPGVIQRFAEDNRPVIWHDRNGRFKGRLVGPTIGNVLLRKAQYKAADNDSVKYSIARNIVAGKIRNCRQVILRGVRDETIEEAHESLTIASRRLAHVLTRIASERTKEEESMDFLRGIEGEASRTYFSAFDRLIKTNKNDFQFDKRTRRPPRNRVNALLSFLYALLLNDCVSSLDGVGLDPQIGFLHEIRPGRPALGLDLMEELRPIFSDRLVLTLINRKQIIAPDFLDRPGDTVHLTPEGRKKVIVAYQERKQDTRLHPVLDQQVPLGLIPHVQARLIARYLRGDIEEYTPFYFR